MDGVWQTLGKVAFDTLGEARVAVHHGLRPVTAVGEDLVLPEEDGSHESLMYDPALGALAGWFVPAPQNVRAALRLADFALLLLDQDDGTMAQTPLAGLTLPEATTWLSDRIRDHWQAADAVRPRDEPDLPYHPATEGAPIEAPDLHALAELERYYANTRLLLLEMQADVRPGPPIRIGPSHLDQALSIDLGTDGEAQAVTAGFSPGEGIRGEPYLYVALRPPPTTGNPPAFDGPGHWQAEPFFGARLDARELVQAGTRQEDAARLFLAESLRIARDAL